MKIGNVQKRKNQDEENKVWTSPPSWYSYCWSSWWTSWAGNRLFSLLEVSDHVTLSSSKQTSSSSSHMHVSSSRQNLTCDLGLGGGLTGCLCLVSPTADACAECELLFQRFRNLRPWRHPAAAAAAGLSRRAPFVDPPTLQLQSSHYSGRPHLSWAGGQSFSPICGHHLHKSWALEPLRLCVRSDIFQSESADDYSGWGRRILSRRLEQLRVLQTAARLLGCCRLRRLTVNWR